MSYTGLFNAFATTHLIILSIIFGGFGLLGVYLRYKHGKNACKVNVLFNSGLIVINGFIIFIMLDPNIEKNSTSIFVFGIAVIQIYRLMYDTLGEIADLFYSVKEHKLSSKERELEIYLKVVEQLDSLTQTQDIVNKKLKILKHIEKTQEELLDIKNKLD